MSENNTEDITIEQLKEELEATTNNWKRTLADFENFKKQKERESKELLEFSKEVTVVKLLPTLDTLAQALKHLPKYNPSTSSGALVGISLEEGRELQTAENSSPFEERLGEVDNFSKSYTNWQMGIKGILMQLDQVLGEMGVKKIEAVGKKFDPHFHEAIKEIEGEEDNIIVEEFQTGFELNGKVIRPSQVTISKKATEGGK